MECHFCGKNSNWVVPIPTEGEEGSKDIPVCDECKKTIEAIIKGKAHHNSSDG